MIGNARVLVGAHYDSVPNCPGADDNASAVAAMLGCAAALAAVTPELPIMFAAFNREEEGFLGSSEFVANYHGACDLSCVHILEMVGFASREPGSQRLPSGLPIQLSSSGDFLGLLGNEQSGSSMRNILQIGRTCTPQLAVSALEIGPGA